MSEPTPSAPRPGHPVCGNEDHLRPVKAWVRMTWPEGPFDPAYSCKGCARLNIADTIDIYEGPVLVTPAVPKGPRRG